MLAMADINPQPAGPKKMLYHYFPVAGRSTEGVGESSTSSNPKPAVIMHVGKLPKSQKPPRKVGRPRKKLVQEARPYPSTSDSESKAGRSMGQACMYRYNCIMIELNCNTIGKETKCIRHIYSASQKVKIA